MPANLPLSCAPGWCSTMPPPLTAKDVCANLRRMARPDKGYTLGAPGVWHQFLGDAIIEATDTRTLTIALSRPIADLLDILAQGFIVAPSCLPQLDTGQLDALVGSGPYRALLRKWRRGIHLANPAW